jgi:2-polyprenyl-3-methyl-5-hydroxy-6-metoxy-1,4-benzoquinol methylase
MENTLFHHFSKEDYWRDFYKANPGECEWIESWEQIKDPLRKYLFRFPELNKIHFLDVGCGSSNVMEKVYELGVDHLTGVDFNKDLISNQIQKYQNRPNFKCKTI